MPIDFPNSPTLGQTFTVSGRTWSWTGTFWDSVAVTVLPGPTGPAGTSGPAGPTGPTGTTGVVAAVAPILYNSGTRTVSLDPNAIQDVEVEILMGVL